MGSDRVLLSEFRRLATAGDEAIQRVARRWGPLLACRACPGGRHAPRLGPINTAVTKERATTNLQVDPAHPKPESCDEWRMIAAQVAAALGLAKALDEAGDLPPESGDWKTLLPGRFHRAPLPSGRSEAAWRPLEGDDASRDGQLRRLCGLVSGWMVGAHVRPGLYWVDEGYRLVLETEGLLGAVAAEVALAIGGGMKGMGEPCSGGCGRMVQRRRIRQEDPYCDKCSARIRKAKWRARGGEK